MKKLSKKLLFTITIIVTLLISSITGIGIVQAETLYGTITLGESGWSNPEAGTFDLLTMTGVLSEDIFGTIEIISDGITLDGAGHSITGDGTNNGVYATENHNLTIKNLNISGCNNGILLSFSNNNIIKDNILTSNLNANLFLSRSEYNIITENSMSDSNYSGILLREFANNNTIQNNEFLGNQTGINLQGAQRNVIMNNLVKDNTAAGIFLSDSPTNIYIIPSRQNQIYRNNFIDNFVHAYIFNYVFNIDNRFFRNVPDGGNYWSGHVSPDVNLDGIADVPYEFFGGTDNLPWMEESGWEDTIPPITPEYLYVYLGNDGFSEDVGTWDPVSKTATLNKDFTGSISIVTNEVTMDGNNHTVSGDGNGIGVQVAMQGYITIKNIKTDNQHYGILFSYAYDTVLENCTVQNSEYGIYLMESRRNSLLNNVAKGNTYGMVLSTLSDENLVVGNLIEGSNFGMDLPGSFDNIIKENTLRDSSETGISIRLQPYTSSSVLHANRNQIYNNDFMNNTIQASVYEEDTENVFNIAAPVGGNFWDNHISYDLNADGFADTPYVFEGGSDELPRMTAFEWHPEEEELPIYEQYANAVSNIIDLFDQAIFDETIAGNGSPGKLNAFSKMLQNVMEKFEGGQIRAGYQKLKSVYGFVDFQKSPKDLVTGLAVEELAEKILQLLLLIEIE